MELRYEPRRVSCTRCGGVYVEATPWVSGKQRMTRTLMRTVASAVDEAIADGLANRDLTRVTRIGIDEILRKGGHAYVTNVYDLERMCLVWSGEGRKQEILEAFFDYLGPEGTVALGRVCCDMWQPYIDVNKKRASEPVLVFDKFHIVRHLIAAVDQVRRDEIREQGAWHKALMYKTRFI